MSKFQEVLKEFGEKLLNYFLFLGAIFILIITATVTPLGLYEVAKGRMSWFQLLLVIIIGIILPIVYIVYFIFRKFIRRNIPSSIINRIAATILTLVSLWRLSEAVNVANLTLIVIWGSISIWFAVSIFKLGLWRIFWPKKWFQK